MKIYEQGHPAVNEAVIQATGENVVAILIDMKSKYCTISGITQEEDGAPSFYISAEDNSLYLNKEATSPDTLVGFPEYKGWTVFAVNCSRYTITVCLIKGFRDKTTEGNKR